MKRLLLTTIMSVKDILTCGLVPMSEQKVMRVAMFVMGGLLLALGVWKMPTLDLGLSGLIIGWMALTVVVGKCIVAGLSLIHISHPTSTLYISYAVLCIQKKIL